MTARAQKMYRMEVRVGTAWVPATPHPVPADEVSRFRRKFLTVRPGATLRAVPMRGASHGR